MEKRGQRYVFGAFVGSRRAPYGIRQRRLLSVETLSALHFLDPQQCAEAGQATLGGQTARESRIGLPSKRL